MRADLTVSMKIERREAVMSLNALPGLRWLSLFVGPANEKLRQPTGEFSNSAKLPPLQRIDHRRVSFGI